MRAPLLGEGAGGVVVERTDALPVGGEVLGQEGPDLLAVDVGFGGVGQFHDPNATPTDALQRNAVVEVGGLARTEPQGVGHAPAGAVGQETRDLGGIEEGERAELVGRQPDGGDVGLGDRPTVEDEEEALVLRRERAAPVDDEQPFNGTVRPISSAISRSHACRGDSSASTAPPGMPHRSRYVGFTSSTRPPASYSSAPAPMRLRGNDS